jgi:shikimate kinase
MLESSNNSTSGGRGMIFLIGFMGSGKSYWGRRWATSYNYNFIDLDHVVEEYEGKSITEIFETKGENYFREIETLILKTLQGRENIIVACGGGTPCFNNNLEWMKQNGITVYLKATPSQLMMRLLAEKNKHPIIKNISDEDFELFISKRLMDREEFYSKADVILNVESIKETTFVNLITNRTKYA